MSFDLQLRWMLMLMLEVWSRRVFGAKHARGFSPAASTPHQMLTRAKTQISVARGLL